MIMEARCNFTLAIELNPFDPNAAGCVIRIGELKLTKSFRPAARALLLELDD